MLNFGFAGNGHDDIGVARHLVTLPAAVIVLDCLPNMNAATVAAKTVPIVKYVLQSSSTPHSHAHATCMHAMLTCGILRVYTTYLATAPRETKLAGWAAAVMWMFVAWRQLPACERPRPDPHRAG